MAIQIITSKEEFVQLVEKLYQYIEDGRNRVRQEYITRERSIPKRISFQEIDLSRHKNEMLSVQKTLHHGYHHNIKGRTVSKARAVAIAGVCEFIKHDYIGRFWDSYRQLIEKGPDSIVYNWIWEKGFKDEGIELVLSSFLNYREFVQSLIQESGIPRRRIGDIIYFFEIYYRYLRKYEDIENLIKCLADDSIIPPALSVAERSKLKGICRDAIEYSYAFARAVERLNTVFEFIEESGDIVTQSIRDYTDLIYEKTGIHPLEILHDEEQLEQLYGRLMGFVTPARLQKILAALPPGTSVLRPSGTSINAGAYRLIQYGEHKIGSALFTCVPAVGIDLGEMDRMPYHKLLQVDGGLLLKSLDKLKVTLDGVERYDLAHWFYIKKMGIPRSEGAVFFSEIPPATSLVIHDEAGRLIEERQPEPGFFFSLSLGYFGNHEQHRHGLKIDVHHFRLHDSSLAGQKFCFLTDENREKALIYSCDRSGSARLDQRYIRIRDPRPGQTTIRSVNFDTLEKLIVKGESVQRSVRTDPVMLFAPVQQWQISAVRKGRSNGSGYEHLALFLAGGIPREAVNLDNLTITGESKCGEYGVLSLKWEKRQRPCYIAVSHQNTEWYWCFDECADYNINIVNDLGTDYRGIRFGIKEGKRAADFKLMLTPVPEMESRKSLLWNVVINDSMPVLTKFESGPEGRLTPEGLEFGPENFSRLVEPALEKSMTGMLRVEISLGKSGHILTSDRIYLFPDLELKIRKLFRDGEAIEADVSYGSKLIHLTLNDNAGNKNACIDLIKGKEGYWQLNHHVYSSKIMIDEVGIEWGIQCTPKVAGCRLVSDKGKQEMLRSLLRRELDDYDVLIIPGVPETPSVTVNDRSIGVDHARDTNIATLHLGDIGRPIKAENKVVIKTEFAQWSFDILYTITAANPNIREHFINGLIFGEIGLSGPENSGAVFEVYEGEVEKANIRGKREIICTDNDFEAQSFDIQIQSPPVPERKYIVKLYLLQNIKDRRNPKEYGKSWEVICRPKMGVGPGGTEDDDFETVIAAVKHEIENGRCFWAKQLLEAMNGMNLDESQKIILRDLTNRIDFLICHKKIESIMRQTRRSLRRDFMLKV